jgi:uncharacterized protein
MIRKATNNDLLQIVETLRSDSSRALFILGDIEAYGLETEFQEVWIDMDEQDLHLVVLRYYENLVWYIVDDVVDVRGFKELINDERILFTGCTHSHYERLPEELKQLIKPRFTYLCECSMLKHGDYSAHLATSEDAAEIISSTDQIEEFTTKRSLSVDQRIERLAQDIVLETCYAMIIKEGNQVIAHAMSSAHTSQGAMIIGVFTLKPYRHQGLARNVMGSLSQHLLAKGMKPVLFYDNPNAGQLYHDLGYVTIDQWVMGTKVESA